MAFTEDNISQIPALRLLANLGYTYLSPAEALELRGGKTTAVLLESVLRDQLKKINYIQVRSKRYEFTDANIERGIDELRNVPLVEGLVTASGKVYNLITFGHALEQQIENDRKSYTLQYIDWENIENNVFHVTEEFSVARMGRKDTYRPDIVLFVNGIPLAVIECKSPAIKEPVREAISQHIRNQQENGIPNLYVYSQILLVTSLVDAKYATTNTKEEFWASWKEKEDTFTEKTGQLVNQPLSEDVYQKLFGKDANRTKFDKDAYDTKYSQPITVSTQDRYIVGLLDQKRLLAIIRDFVFFEGGVTKKVARYQQFFSINKIINRIKHIKNGKRQGGVVWHTQGSGKSLTMAMLANKIRQTVKNPKIILVTDRVDLDRQITTTLQRVKVDVINAEKGSQLAALLKGNGDDVITTIINKFEAAVNTLKDYTIESPDVFVLIDEGHRTQYGTFNVKMQRALPNACFIAFTGTPLLKNEKNTAKKFGGIIDSYTISEAVEDGAIVPILYEGRLAVQDINKKALDKGFDRVAEGLAEYARADLKKSMNKANLLVKTEQNIDEIAYDISKHFSETWGTDKMTGEHSGFRGMVVCPDKLTAVRYKKAFDIIGKVRTEVVMSPPDTRENNEDIHSSEADEVVKYYELQKAKYGPDIDKTIISVYENGQDIELLIVIDKLLTGFDVPQTTVMYLCRKLKEHTLLQAIARVNRVYRGKQFGFIIDYAGIMEELQEAMEKYSNGYDAEDLEGTFTDMSSVYNTLPQKYEELKRIFRTIRNEKDINECIKLFADEQLREEFYKKFSEYGRVLKIALSSVEFDRKTSKEDIEKYKNALNKYAIVRKVVNETYEDRVNFSQYEKQLQKLLDQHVITEEIVQLVEPISILNTDLFERELEKLYGPRSKAEKIAAATAKYLSVNVEEDPVLYRRLSELIRQTIDDMRSQRISELQALKKLTGIKNKIIDSGSSDLPETLNKHKWSAPVYRIIEESDIDWKGKEVEIISFFDELILKNTVVEWEKKPDIINTIELEFGDYLMDNFDVSIDEADKITKHCIKIAIANQ